MLGWVTRNVNRRVEPSVTRTRSPSGGGQVLGDGVRQYALALADAVDSLDTWRASGVRCHRGDGVARLVVRGDIASARHHSPAADVVRRLSALPRTR
jgi:hypothetical protein